MRTYEEQQKLIADENFKRQKAKFLADVYHANPTYAPNMANDKRIFGVVEEVYGQDVVPNLALFESAIALNPDIKFVRRTVAYQIGEITEEIIEALESTNNPYWNVAAAVARVKAEAAEQVANGATANSLATAIVEAKARVNHNIKNERAKLALQRPEQLRARLAEVLEAQRLQKLSATELHSAAYGELEARRAAEQPSRVVLPAEYTAERLKRDVVVLKKAVRLFGSDACNSRLMGRS